VKAAASALQRALAQGREFEGSAEARRLQGLLDAYLAGTIGPAARQQAEDTLGREPAHVPALLVAGMAAQQDGRYGEARRLYEESMRVRPGFAPAAKQLAVLFAGPLADEDQAYALATEARRTLTEDPALARILGMIHYRRGQLDYAARLLEESLRAEPNEADAWLVLGLCHAGRSDPLKAKQAIERGLGLDPDSPYAETARQALQKGGTEHGEAD
jgi:tetratricopeptide (TPR) repeat protein